METDLKLSQTMTKFATDLAVLVAKRDGAAVVAQLDRMEAVLKPLPKGQKAPTSIQQTPPPGMDELETLIEGLSGELQVILTERDQEVVKGRFEALRQQLLNPTPPAFFRPPKLASPKRVGPDGQPIPHHNGAGQAATPKKCPVPTCQTMTVARRFSYLCDLHRTDQNLTAYRSGS